MRAGYSTRRRSDCSWISVVALQRDKDASRGQNQQLDNRASASESDLARLQTQLRSRDDSNAALKRDVERLGGELEGLEDALQSEPLRITQLTRQNEELTLLLSDILLRHSFLRLEM